MAVAQSYRNDKSLEVFSNCYKVSGLTNTILDTDQIANLKDLYVLGKQLGWGQFGVIKACSNKLNGEVLACKSIAKDRLVTSEDVQSVKLEIEIMTRLSGHPYVVDLKAVYEEKDYVHLVMELCAGGELFHRLEKYGRFSEAKARVLFRQLMQVVMYCHEKGVVHRDLKPENILLSTKSSSSPIKLADFGLATYIKPGQRLHGTVGSPFYIAHEVLGGGYNQAADLWSAGVILYILLSGVPPFWGKTKSRIFDAVRAADLRFLSDPWDSISESAKDLIRGMLCKDPAQRLTAQEVLEHSWMRDNIMISGRLLEYGNQISRFSDSRESSLPTPFMARDEDISFGTGTPIICHVQSPSLTCTSSFSTFQAEPSTPTFVSGGFSFCSIDKSNSLELHPPVCSMTSFAFFNTSSISEQGNCSLSFSAEILRVDAVCEGENSSNLIVVSNSSVCLESSEVELHGAKPQRSEAPNGTRGFGIQNKRNHTISFGELNLVVTESVIRWASCTHLPTAPSLRSSLVC